MTRPNIVLGITGASGAIYAVRLLQVLVAAGQHVQLSISPSAQLVLRQELNSPSTSITSISPTSGSTPPAPPPADSLRRWPKCCTPRRRVADGPGRVIYHHHQDLMAPIASGSFPTAGMVICPCSGGTLGAVVHGTGQQPHPPRRRGPSQGAPQTDRRPARDAAVDRPLDNLRRAAEAGAVVLPACPASITACKRSAIWSTSSSPASATNWASITP